MNQVFPTSPSVEGVHKQDSLSPWARPLILTNVYQTAGPRETYIFGKVIISSLQNG
jgi:hypothetical protein